MRIIADIFKNPWYSKKEEARKETENIIEIDCMDDCGMNIFMKDKRNTTISISEEDLLSHITDGMYEKLINMH